MRRKTLRQRGGGGAGGNNGAENRTENGAVNGAENGAVNGAENGAVNGAVKKSKLARVRRGSIKYTIPFGATPFVEGIPVEKRAQPWSLFSLFQTSKSVPPTTEVSKQSESEPTIEDELEQLNAKLKGKNPKEYLFILTKEEYDNINKVRENNKTLFEPLYIRGVTQYEIRIINFLRTKRLTLEQLDRCYSSS